MTKLLLEFCLNQSFSDRFLVGFGLLKAVLIAAFAWWFCGFSMRLWNRRFRMCLMHHCFCALSAIITIAALFLFNCVGAMDKFVSLAVNVWQAEYQNDATYRHETFVLIYHQLQAMYQQNGWTWDYSKYPQPTESPSIASQDHAETFSIPWNSAHSWMRRYLGEDAEAAIVHPEIVSGFGFRILGMRVPDNKCDTAATIIPSVGCPLGCNFCRSE